MTASVTWFGCSLSVTPSACASAAITSAAAVPTTRRREIVDMMLRSRASNAPPDPVRSWRTLGPRDFELGCRFGEPMIDLAPHLIGEARPAVDEALPDDVSELRQRCL